MAAGNYFETNFVDHHIIPQQFFSSSPLLQKLVTDFGASGFTVNSHLNLQSLPTDPAIARDMGVSVHNGGPLGSYQDEVGAKLNSIAETADGMAYLSGTADAATKARVLAQVAGFRDTMRVAIGNGELYTNAGSLNPGADPNFATALANEYNDSFFAKINGPNGIAGYLDQGNGSRRADFNLVVSNTGANVRWGLLNDKVAVRSLTHVVRRDPDGLIAVAFAAVGGKILYDLALKNGLDPFDPQDQPALFTKFTELGGQLSQSEFMSFISANLTDAAIGALTPGGLAKQAVNMLMSGEDALEVMKLAANAWPESSSAATLAEAAVALEATPAWERYKLYREMMSASSWSTTPSLLTSVEVVLASRSSVITRAPPSSCVLVTVMPLDVEEPGFEKTSRTSCLLQSKLLALSVIVADNRASVPVLAKGKCTTGRLWAYVRDDQPFGGASAPAVVYHYSPTRGGEHPERHLAAYSGLMQADAYSGYNNLYAPGRVPGAIIEAACWAHGRRKFFELAELQKAPVAIEAVRRIDELFAIERDINGRTPDERCATRQERTKPLVDALETWLREQRKKLSSKNDTAKAIDYSLKRWRAFTRFLDDGRLCMSNNAAERAVRGIAVGRKNWTFCGSDSGGRRAAAIYTLIETCKLNDVDARVWLADVLARIADHPAKQIGDLLPWKWKTARAKATLAA